MDIGELIDFKKHGGQRNGVPFARINQLLNRRIHILSWEITKSAFDDGSGVLVIFECIILSNNMHVYSHTGSRVIANMLNEISEKMDKMHVTDRTFTCVIRKTGEYIKMYPADSIWEG